MMGDWIRRNRRCCGRVYGEAMKIGMVSGELSWRYRCRLGGGGSGVRGDGGGVVVGVLQGEMLGRRITECLWIG